MSDFSMVLIVENVFFFCTSTQEVFGVDIVRSVSAVVLITATYAISCSCYDELKRIVYSIKTYFPSSHS
jgi:hypothetical protein